MSRSTSKNQTFLPLISVTNNATTSLDTQGAPRNGEVPGLTPAPAATFSRPGADADVAEREQEMPGLISSGDRTAHSHPSPCRPDRPQHQEELDPASEQRHKERPWDRQCGQSHGDLQQHNRTKYDLPQNTTEVWAGADGRARTVFGLGFSSEQQLTTFAEKFQELKEAAEMPKDKAREKTETWSHAPSSAAASSVKGGDEKASQPLQPTRTGSLRRTRWDRRDAERGHCAGAEAAAAAPEERHAPRTTALQETVASGEPRRGRDTNREEEKNTQPERRMEELEAELREQETELKGLRKQSEIPPQLLSERLCRREAPGGQERMKTRKTEVAP
ncbi:hypothetical protein P7K49_018863 [Saguinus oedipus]|uniref:WH1 domain-containing protein n=1 Tax=Saguinus oedipus TaxID=9490 RepID=A0ABQ9V9B3_SAGOE|nr:hypothetical protein P7K49_018863 [Saguinus oedipus]